MRAPAPASLAPAVLAAGRLSPLWRVESCGRAWCRPSRRSRLERPNLRLAGAAYAVAAIVPEIRSRLASVRSPSASTSRPPASTPSARRPARKSARSRLRPHPTRHPGNRIRWGAPPPPRSLLTSAIFSGRKADSRSAGATARKKEKRVVFAHSTLIAARGWPRSSLGSHWAPARLWPRAEFLEFPAEG
jgi:hypothetical protein